MSDRNIDKDIEILRKEQKELKETRDMFDKGNEIYNECEEVIQAIENVLLELETYKKIAEKLAEELEKCSLDDKEGLLDWARKEVEKDVP